MRTAPAMTGSDWPDSDALRDALRAEEVQSQASMAMLPHLLRETDDSLHTEAIVAHMRGLLRSLAIELLTDLAEASGEKARDVFVASRVAALVDRLAANALVIEHAHHRALEWRIGRIVEERLHLDGVLSPLLQTFVGDEDQFVASTAMAVLAAQTRFSQAERRRELNTKDLPLEVLGAALSALRAEAEDISDDAFMRTEQKVSSRFDESATRLSLLERLFGLRADRRGDWLQLDQAGPALFLTALAQSTRQSRSTVAAACVTKSQARLALSLRAAGMRPEPVERQCRLLAPDREPPRGLEDVGTREALQMLGGDRQGRMR